ncbi:MAG TPA: hypothetical protein VGY53_02875, partial [Isosphaeraceae bacterium]|nr:hypothetical protein [Isosphaeraceae bacterium]
VVLIFPLVLLSCPPWSLKGVIAQRAQCVWNLKYLHHVLEAKGVRLDQGRLEQVQEMIRAESLACPEGTKIRGRPALYHAERRNGSLLITEESGNHPARTRFLAGSVPAQRFGIDSDGNTIR